MIYKYNNIELKGQFIDNNGNTYPVNWLDLSNNEDKINIGITILEEVWEPLLTELHYYDGSYEDINTQRIYKTKTAEL